MYSDFKKYAFDKSFDDQRGQIYVISQVLAGDRPVIYRLKDLKGAAVVGTFYKENLRRALPPEQGYHPMTVLKTRTRKGKVEKFVKYKHYPAKFNEWLPAENVHETQDLHLNDGE